MKVIIVMSMSLNGIICLEDRTEGFLSTEGGELVSKQVLEVGSLVCGRGTYENVLKVLKGSVGWDLASTPKVVVSSKPNYEVVDGYMSATSPEAAIKLLESKGVTQTALVGGSKLTSAFMASGLVDEMRIDVEPVVVGKGVPLFDPKEFEVQTELDSVEKVNNGELLLKYKVVK